MMSFFLFIYKESNLVCIFDTAGRDASLIVDGCFDFTSLSAKSVASQKYVVGNEKGAFRDSGLSDILRCINESLVFRGHLPCLQIFRGIRLILSDFNEVSLVIF